MRFYPSGRIEIGFTDVGPVVAMLGTLRVKNRELFVASASLTVERLQDGAKHDFSWYAFRLDAGENSRVIPATGFMLEPRTPLPINVVYRDVSTGESVREALQPVRTAWEAHYQSMTAVHEGMELPEVTPNDLSEMQRVFRTSDDTVRVAHNRLNRDLYWNEGRYLLTLRIVSDDLPQEFTQSWTFALTSSDAELLGLNPIVLVAQTSWDANAGQPRWSYADYEATQ